MRTYQLSNTKNRNVYTMPSDPFISHTSSKDTNIETNKNKNTGQNKNQAIESFDATILVKIAGRICVIKMIVLFFRTNWTSNYIVDGKAHFDTKKSISGHCKASMVEERRKNN